MTRTRPPGRHLDGRTALDYLEHLLSGRARADVEEHLGLPCPTCHERIRELGGLLERMRLDRVGDPPEALHALAVAAFSPSPTPFAVRGVIEELARLLFDSWAEPLPAATRRAVGEARRMRYALGDGALELECEVEVAGAVSLRGRLELEDPSLYRIEVTSGEERASVFPDDHGSFAFDRIPRGIARLLIVGPAAQYRLPPLTF